jgi:hypothetical protein
MRFDDENTSTVDGVAETTERRTRYGVEVPEMNAKSFALAITSGVPIPWIALSCELCRREGGAVFQVASGDVADGDGRVQTHQGSPTESSKLLAWGLIAVHQESHADQPAKPWIWLAEQATEHRQMLDDGTMKINEQPGGELVATLHPGVRPSNRETSWGAAQSGVKEIAETRHSYWLSFTDYDESLASYAAGVRAAWDKHQDRKPTKRQ